MMIQRFKQGPRHLVDHLNQMVDLLNFLSNVIGGGAAQSIQTMQGRVNSVSIEQIRPRIPRKTKTVGMGLVYRAKTTEDAPSYPYIVCNLIKSDGSEAGSGEFGYNITVYALICGGGNLNAAVPRLSDDDSISVYQGYDDEGEVKWYCTTQFNASVNCTC